jgi:hypothetical protein
MVGKIVSRTFLFLLFLLALSSCGILTSSFFPEDLMQVSARKDLSDEIPKEAANYFVLSAVTANGVEYVVLASNIAYDGVHVIFMDSGLNVVSAFTYSELSAPAISTEPFQGNRAFADSNTPSRVVMGNRWFRPSTSGFILETQPGMTTPANAPNNYWGSGFGTPNYNVAKLVAGTTLSYYLWLSNWSAAPTQYSVTINTGAGSYNLIGVFPDPTLDKVVLVFRNDTVLYDDFLVIPRSDFVLGGTLTTTVDTIFNLYAGSHITRPRSEQNVIGYAQNGMIAFSPSGGDEKSGDMVRFDLNGNPLSGSLHIEKLEETQNAYPVAGGHYYSFNRKTRVVTKLNAWWK